MKILILTETILHNPQMCGKDLKNNKFINFKVNKIRTQEEFNSNSCMKMYILMIVI